MAADDGLINHTVHQMMAWTAGERVFVALCSCGWEAQAADCEENVAAIGRHMDETMPDDIRAAWVGVKR